MFDQKFQDKLSDSRKLTPLSSICMLRYWGTDHPLLYLACIYILDNSNELRKMQSFFCFFTSAFALENPFSLSVRFTQSCPTLCGPMGCSTPGFPVHHQPWSLLKLMSIKSVMPSNNLILCRPLLLPSILPSIRVFSNELVLYIRWPKYWSFRFSISPSNDYSGLISFRIDWFDLFAVQGTLKSLTLQFESINSLALSLLYGPTLTSIHGY